MAGIGFEECFNSDNKFFKDALEMRQRYIRNKRQ
jgi:hypothetical protein